MNFFPMNTGGGKLEETVLWTNPSPSSQMGSQQITLLDNIRNYDFLKVEFCDSYVSTDLLSNVIFPVIDVLKFDASTSFRGGLSQFGSGSNSLYHRVFGYINDTTLSFDATMQTYISGNTRQYVSGVTIPTRIIGMKQTQGGGTVDPPTLVDTLLWSNSNPTSDFGNANISLSDDMDNYDYLKFVWKNQKSTTEISSLMISVTDFKTHGGDSGNYEMFPTISGNVAGATYGRYIVYVDDATIAFGSSTRLGATTQNNAYTTPLQIYGVKKTSDNVALNIQGANIGTLARYASTNITIDLDKDYVLWEALLQDDSTYRACCYSIRKGVISHIPNSGNDGNGYITNSISGNILTLTQRGAAAAASARYGLIQLD